MQSSRVKCCSVLLHAALFLSYKMHNSSTESFATTKIHTNSLNDDRFFLRSVVHFSTFMCYCVVCPLHFTSSHLSFCLSIELVCSVFVWLVGVFSKKKIVIFVGLFFIHGSKPVSCVRFVLAIYRERGCICLCCLAVCMHSIYIPKIIVYAMFMLFMLSISVTRALSIFLLVEFYARFALFSMHSNARTTMHHKHTHRNSFKKLFLIYKLCILWVFCFVFRLAFENCCCRDRESSQRTIMMTDFDDDHDIIFFFFYVFSFWLSFTIHCC